MWKFVFIFWIMLPYLSLLMVLEQVHVHSKTLEREWVQGTEHTVNNAIVIPSTMQSRAPCKDQVHTLLIPQKYSCRSKTLIKPICSPLLSNRTFFYSWCSFSCASDLIACFIFFFHWISSLHLSQTLRFSYVAQLLQCWLFFSFLTSLDSRKSKSLSHLLLQPLRGRVSNVWVRHWCSASLYWS